MGVSAKHGIRLLPLALLVMGAGGPCTSSQYPLTDRDEGFVDPSLVGLWGDAEISEDLALDGEDSDDIDPLDPRVKPEDINYTVELQITYDKSGSLRLLRYEDGKVYQVLTGYTSIIDGKRYLNVKPLTCPGCTAERQAQIKEDECQYMIIQYRFDLPPNFLPPEEEGKFAASIEKFDLQLLYYSLMSNEFVKESIKNGLIAGDPECEECFWSPEGGDESGGVCIKSTQEELQQFIRDNEKDLYAYSILDDPYVRVPRSAISQAAEPSLLVQ